MLSARNLPPRPATIKALSLRDSYCTVSFSGARQVTPVMRQSQSPTWNYSALFPLDTNPLEGRGELAAAGSSGGGGGVKQDGPSSSDLIQSGAAVMATEDAGGILATRSAPVPRLRPPPLLLRIDMKDVDPVPPDDDLG